ncbi:MAG: glycosyltransferase family 2 protein, partial [Sphingomicrobium sp.]
GDALYRVVAYDEVGGFRADLLAGEEPELCTRLQDSGWEVWRIDSRMTEHDARMLRFGQWWRRSLRGGYGYAQVWDVTRKLYGRQLASAVAWALVLPLAVFVAALIMGSSWVLAGIPIAYAVQTVRIYRKIADGRPQRMFRAALTFLAKVPETLGALRYLLKAARPSMGIRP